MRSGLVWMMNRFGAAAGRSRSRSCCRHRQAASRLPIDTASRCGGRLGPPALDRHLDLAAEVVNGMAMVVVGGHPPPGMSTRLVAGNVAPVQATTLTGKNKTITHGANV